MPMEKGVLILTVLGGSMALAQNIVHKDVNPNSVTVVHTALGHISILELPEKITRVAEGSQVMQIEWHGNSVFIKPLKTGESTNLMVWTEHGVSGYELEAPGSVANMSFVIDQTNSSAATNNAAGGSARAPSKQEVQSLSDTLIGSTLLETSPVIARGIEAPRDFVSVRIKEVVRDKNSLYVRFAVTNTGQHPYRVHSPDVYTITPTKKAELLPGLRNEQIAEEATYQFQSRQTSQVPVRGTELAEKDVAPGATVEGVLTLEPPEPNITGVYEFVFLNDGSHRIRVTAVL
jgi:hypothetical protein